MTIKKLFILPILILCTSAYSWAISPNDSLEYVNWQNLSPKTDKAWGIETDKAYTELLKSKPSKTIVVAVIDNGVDINHEDLKPHIWINEDEIPDNGIDDDHNGFIDDVHGWNFLGNAEGENISQAPMEVTRLYTSFNQKYDGRPLDSIEGLNQNDYERYRKVIYDFEKERNEAEQLKAYFDGITEKYQRFDSTISALLKTTEYSIKDVKKLKVEKHSSADTAKKYMLWIKRLGITPGGYDKMASYLNNEVNYNYNATFTPRQNIINDDVNQLDYAQYGNNDVIGENPDHGTMVAGLISASRNNGLGINGVANNVKIMAIRAVPDGDEWDKDIANAIKYAIENGADIINMSFGKGYSPQKHFVDEVVALADQKDVLLVHAAGNDSENNDSIFSYPRKYNENEEVIVNNWLTVGATSKEKKKKKFVASFSNYGQNTVDIFAPGDNILTCAPNNQYDMASGTSFSAPMVSGAAALIKAYYPGLTSAELKEILLESSDKEKLNVVLPGTAGKHKTIVPFSSLSVSGGLLNVYKALQLAETKSTTP